MPRAVTDCRAERLEPSDNRTLFAERMPFIVVDLRELIQADRLRTQDWTLEVSYISAAALTKRSRDVGASLGRSLAIRLSSGVPTGRITRSLSEFNLWPTAAIRSRSFCRSGIDH
jgi:hypothetical protein